MPVISIDSFGNITEKDFPLEEVLARFEKRAAWARIQAEHPALAAFLAEYRRAFGKPAAARVTRTTTHQILLQTGDAWTFPSTR